MKNILKEKFEILWRRIVEAGTACFFLMTQGNTIALKAKHFINAGKTGLITGLMAVALSFCAKKELQDNKYIVAGAVAFLTAVADILVHPGKFGGPETEAIITGIGAGLLSLALSYIKKSDNK